MISGWWIALPVIFSILGAAISVLSVLYKHASSQLVFMAAFYVCIAFFAHAYSLGWRKRSFFAQYSAFTITVILLLIAAWLHLDYAGFYTEQSGSLNSKNRLFAGSSFLFFASGLDGIVIILMILHGIIFGFGSRRFVIKETDSSETDSLETNSSETNSSEINSKIKLSKQIE